MTSNAGSARIAPRSRQSPRGEEQAAGEDGEALEALFDELAAAAAPACASTPNPMRSSFAASRARRSCEAAKDAHPRLKILGLLEARLMDADLMLLGGLDETVWPPQAKADAFLNRPMRAALGLTPPERKLGQTAHDFTQGLGRARVILSRAQKRGGAPTVASRFLQRLAALGGERSTVAALRGKKYVELARLIDRSAGAAREIKRPLPRPPVDLRPTSLSVTKIEILRRDPYALYAEKILDLIPLDPIARRRVQPTQAAGFMPRSTVSSKRIHAANCRWARGTNFRNCCARR